MATLGQVPGPGPGLGAVGGHQIGGHDTHGEGEGAAKANQVNSSYSDRVKMRIQKSERLKRNVLEINLECLPPAHGKVDKEVVAKLFSRIGIDIKSQVEAYQIIPKKIYVWMKASCELDKFCKDECFRVTDGVKTGIIKPMDRREVAVCIRGINFNTPDNLVIDYINKFGQVINNKVIYDEDREGPLKGIRNGDRKYLVDFSGGRNMGTFHLLDGAKVNVSYPGQRKTCGRCHKTAAHCPGGGWARACEEKEGARVTLIDHIKGLWKEIGFEPSNFGLEGDDDSEDVEIRGGTHFTPTHRKQEITPAEASKFTGVAVKNLPKDIPENDIKHFLEASGLPMGCNTFTIMRTSKNTNVDVEDLSNSACSSLIKNIHGKVFFNLKIYCRGMSNVMTPKKKTDIENESESGDADKVNNGGAGQEDLIVSDLDKAADTATDTATTAATESAKTKGNVKKGKKSDEKTKPHIPGLPVEKVNKQNKKKNKNKLGLSSHKNLNKNDFLIAEPSKVDDYIFSDSQEDSENDDNSSKFFERSPLESISEHLTPRNFSSRTSKAIEKEELWHLTVKQTQKAREKRPLNSPESEQPKTRLKNI